MNLNCGTVLNLECGAVLNLICGTILNLDCENILNLKKLSTQKPVFKTFNGTQTLVILLKNMDNESLQRMKEKRNLH